MSPGPLTRHLARHGWRVRRFRHGLVTFEVGQEVRLLSNSTLVPLRGEVLHLEVARRTGGGLKLAAITVRIGARLVLSLPPDLFEPSPHPRRSRPTPKLRLVASQGA